LNSQSIASASLNFFKVPIEIVANYQDTEKANIY